jgi:hypothetical protein
VAPQLAGEEGAQWLSLALILTAAQPIWQSWWSSAVAEAVAEAEREEEKEEEEEEEERRVEQKAHLVLQRCRSYSRRH